MLGSQTIPRRHPVRAGDEDSNNISADEVARFSTEEISAADSRNLKKVKRWIFTVWLGKWSNQNGYGYTFNWMFVRSMTVSSTRMYKSYSFSNPAFRYRGDHKWAFLWLMLALWYYSTTLPLPTLRMTKRPRPSLPLCQLHAPGIGLNYDSTPI